MKLPRLSVIALLVSLLFVFLGTLSLVTGQRLFLSPDENANQFFAETFARTGMLSSYEPLGAALDDALHPRSVVSVAGELVPVSFLGLPAMFGMFARVFGVGVLPLLTPFLFVLSVIAFRRLMYALFDVPVAYVASFLYVFHPALWYYAGRGLMHNVPFAAFLVMAAYVWVCRPFATHTDSARWAVRTDAVVSGALLGLAICFRASEVLWLVPALAAAVLAARIRIPLIRVSLVLVGVGIGIAPLLFLNAHTYGSPFAFGYTVQSTVATDPATVDFSLVEIDTSTTVQPAAFPFGIHPRTALRHLYAYGFGLFWWMTFLAIIGAPLVLRIRALAPDQRVWRRAYIAFFVVTAGYLALMYGSWSIQDNPDPSAVTIGNSYIRYWIPAFILSIPLSATGIVWVASRALTPFARKAATVVLVGVCVILSARLVFLTPGDGFVDARSTLLATATIRDQILSLTEPNAVIVVDRADKFVFPYRRVVTPLRNEHTYELMPRIIRRVPLYYYGITFPEQDLTYLNTEKLPPLGLVIEPVHTIDIETLYRIRQK